MLVFVRVVKAWVSACDHVCECTAVLVRSHESGKNRIAYQIQQNRLWQAGLPQQAPASDQFVSDNGVLPLG